MKYFEKAEVSSSWRPILSPNESLIIQQGSVGLYEGKNKAENYQDGVCYLTSHRVVYVDSSRSSERAVQLPLHLVKSVESYSGFLRSSPKIILHLGITTPTNSSSSSRQQTPFSPAALSSPGKPWVCTICSFSNKESAQICDLCGVKRLDTHTSLPPAPSKESVEAASDNPTACKVCTFINHPSMIQCEMCGNELPSASAVLSSVNASISEQLSEAQRTIDEDAHVRLAFRSGGQSSFLARLKDALEAKAWDKPAVESSSGRSSSSLSVTRSVGISAIQDRIAKTNLAANETMTDAFQDLDRLMAKATEMVKLAESISMKMSKDNTKTDDEMSILRTYLLNLGISDPVTRGTAGSIYHQELARELAEFLSKFLDKEDGMKPLTDLYCLFNRARGVALISPEDLYKASQQFETLRLPYRLRRFPSGLLVIQSLDMDDDRAAQRIHRHIKEHGGSVTALQLAELEQLALPVATEQLMIAERKGLICRDQGPAGITFYDNLFLSS